MDDNPRIDRTDARARPGRAPEVPLPGDVLPLVVDCDGGARLRVLGIVQPVELGDAAPSPALARVHADPDFELVDWAEARAPSPLANLDTLVIVLDHHARVCWVNGALERITGQPTADLPGRPFEQVQQRLGLNVDLAQIASTLVDGRGWSADLRLRTGSGELRRLRAHVDAIRDPGGQVLGALLCARDETELHRLRSVAEAVNLATNVGQMFAGIRHELGNPINSIKTALTVLSSSWATFEPTSISHYLDRMLAEVGRVEYLLRSLRSFSAFEDLQLRRVIADDTLAEIIRVARRLASERGVELSVDAEPGIAVHADERALYQILLNLVTNALDAVSDSHGQVTLRLRRLGGSLVALEVIDDGEGIPAERLEAIRRPFFTTKPHGTGLGLTIVDRLTAEMNGELVIESRPGRTAMRVLLVEAVHDA